LSDVVVIGAGLAGLAAARRLAASGGQWVGYSTPGADGAEYIAVCVPAFAPDTVHRDE
jgi:flavin-dependent dehydrogenase